MKNLKFKGFETIDLSFLKKNLLFYLLGLVGLYYNLLILKLDKIDIATYLLVNLLASVAMLLADFRFYEKNAIRKSFWKKGAYIDYSIGIELIVVGLLIVPFSILLWFYDILNVCFLLYIVIYGVSNLSIAAYSRLKNPTFYEATNLGYNFLIKILIFYGVLYFNFDLNMVFILASLKEALVAILRLRNLKFTIKIPPVRLLTKYLYFYRHSLITSWLKLIRSKADSLIVLQLFGDKGFVFYRTVQVYMNTSTMLISPIITRLNKRHASLSSQNIKHSNPWKINLLASIGVSGFMTLAYMHLYGIGSVYYLVLICGFMTNYVVYPCTSLRYQLKSFKLIAMDNYVMIGTSVLFYISLFLGFFSLNQFLILSCSFGFIQLLFFKVVYIPRKVSE